MFIGFQNSPNKICRKTWNSFYVQYSYNTPKFCGFWCSYKKQDFFLQLSKFCFDFENAHSPFQSYASSKPSVEVEIHEQKPYQQ